MSQPLLSGGQEYVEGEVDTNLARLESDVISLTERLAAAEQEMAFIKGVLRRQLAAFQQSFGDSPTPVAINSPDGDRWAAVKRRLTPRLCEAIDLLLLQGTMKRTQMAGAMRMDYSNCTKNVIGILIRQGWVIDNNGNLELKNI